MIATEPLHSILPSIALAGTACALLVITLALPQKSSHGPWTAMGTLVAAFLAWVMVPPGFRSPVAALSQIALSVLLTAVAGRDQSASRFWKLWRWLCCGAFTLSAIAATMSAFAWHDHDRTLDFARTGMLIGLLFFLEDNVKHWREHAAKKAADRSERRRVWLDLSQREP